jgi:hypothetical protein
MQVRLTEKATTVGELGRAESEGQILPRREVEVSKHAVSPTSSGRVTQPLVPCGDLDQAARYHTGGRQLCNESIKFRLSSYAFENCTLARRHSPFAVAVLVVRCPAFCTGRGLSLT